MKRRMIRMMALALCMVVFLTSSYQVTFGYIVEKTESLINIFKPFTVAHADLQIKKTIEHPFGEGYEIPDTVSFDFAVELGALYANTQVGTTAGPVTADGDGTLRVSVGPDRVLGIEGLDAGTQVTVRELDQADDGFTSKDGRDVMTATVAEGQAAVMEFVNVYQPKSVSAGMVSLTVNKVLDGREWQEDDSFAVALAWDQGKDEWLDLGVKRSAGQSLDMSESLDSIVLDALGRYTFRMTEVMDGRDNLDYDKTVNTFTVEVTDRDMDGALEIGKVETANNTKVSALADGQFAVAATFTNVYVAPTELILHIENTVEGTVIGPEGFLFELEGEGQTWQVTTDEQGKATLNLPYTLVDAGKEYHYTLCEINDGKENVIYDERVYEITVRVSREGAAIVVTVTVDGEAAENPLTLRFANGYKVPGEDQAPSTGSDLHIWVWFLLMFVSAAGMFFLLITDAKYRKKH